MSLALVRFIRVYFTTNSRLNFNSQRLWPTGSVYQQSWSQQRMLENDKFRWQTSSWTLWTLWTHKVKQNNLEDVVVGDVCSEACEWLTPAATDTHQQCVTSRLLHDPRYMWHVLHCKSVPNTNVEISCSFHPRHIHPFMLWQGWLSDMHERPSFSFWRFLRPWHSTGSIWKNAEQLAAFWKCIHSPTHSTGLFVHAHHT